MDLGIKGKKVLVTGASQGIGRAIALAFAKEQGRVFLVARQEEKLRQVFTEMGGASCGHSFCAADLIQEKAVEQVLNKFDYDKEGFDIVVHSIGGTLNVRDISSPAEEWARVWKLNVGIAIDINRQVIASMQKQKWGRIIHLSSSASTHLRGAAPYAAAKAYLNAYVTATARALAKEGIVISAVVPGVIETPGGSWDENSPVNLKDKEAFLRKKNDLIGKYEPLGRLGKPEEIASFVLFMASTQASYAAGSIVPVTGGGS